MTKFLDYKFILMLFLSLVVYFLYREIESISKRLSNIEKGTLNNNQALTYKEIENHIIEQLNSQEQNNLALDTQHVEQHLENVLESEDEIVNENEELVYEEDVQDMNESDNEEENINFNDNTMEEFSNEVTEEVQIYSNDNEDDNHTSVIESLEDMTRLDNQDTVDSLLKNKLKELQEMAEDYNIPLNQGDSSKRKTKLQLAQEIISEKKISKI